MKWIIILILLSSLAAANVKISMIYYDPIGTESGGEAIMLHNYADNSIDISSYVIATESSMKDAIIPKETILNSDSDYLIADNGWSESKDDESWRNADHEEAITLNNKDSGIILFDQFGNKLDAVGWGEPENNSFYTGTPLPNIEPGLAYVRKNSTNNNIEDFVNSSAPLNYEKEENTLAIQIEVLEYRHKIEKIEIEDDLSKEGIQISPIPGKTRNVKLQVFMNTTEEINVYANFLSKNYELTKGNDSHYGTISIDYDTEPGEYELLIESIAGTNTVETRMDITITELIAVKIIDHLLNFGKQKAGSLVEHPAQLKNIGNIELDLAIQSSELSNGENKITPSSLSCNIDGEEKSLSYMAEHFSTNLNPGQEIMANFAISLPVNLTGGLYTGKIDFIGIAK